MESHARYLLVGAFTLLCISLSVVLFSWINDEHDQENSTTYRIVFTDSIRGLSPGSEVQYLGVPIGTVSHFRLLPGQPPRVEVAVSVDAGVPVYADTRAELQMQGITGLAMIELFPGPSKNAEPPSDPDEITLQGTGSLLSRLASSTDVITTDVDTVLQKINLLLSDENLATIKRFLSNISKSSDQLDTLIGNVNGLTTDFHATGKHLQSTLQRIDGIAESTEKSILPHVSSALAGMEKTSEKFNAALDEHKVDHLMRSINTASTQLIFTLREMEIFMDQLHHTPDSLVYQREQRGLELPR